MESIANLYVSEGTASTSTVLTLPWRARQITITNDSDSKDLKVKFKSGQNYVTLKPLETWQPKIKSKTVYLNGTGVYRVWGEG